MINSITTTGITISYELEPTKKQIIQRLFEQGHITFNELWTLLQDEPEVQYIPMGVPNDVIITPWNPDITFTNDTDNTRFHNSTGGRRNPEAY